MANRAPALDPCVFSIDDLQKEGGKKLPISYRDYYDGGAMDLVTLLDNVDAYNRYKIRPRIFRDVSNIDTSAELFGQKVSFPLGLSPTAMQRLAHPDGELASSRAAASLGIPMCLSSYSNTPLEDVKSQSDGNPYMMQMCIVRDRNVTQQLIDRAKAAGYRAIFVSVDVPVLGRRLNEMRNNFTLPEDLTFPNILSSGSDEFADSAATKDSGPQAYDDTLQWDEIIPWLKSHAGDMQVWLKGGTSVTTPADIELAIRWGVDGVVISNHGGRQLDGMPATLDALAECAPIARGKIQIAVDGGIRRGSDIFKAIALGARFCFIGRIVIWGLANKYKGQEGVELGIKLLLSELQTTMALAGRITDITREHLSVLGNNGLLAKL